MSNVSLKSLLRKRSETTDLLTRLADSLETSFSLQDVEGRWLAGEAQEAFAHKFQVEADGEVLGWVFGEAKAEALAQLLSLLAAKESEKKRIGAEVLDLYREINLIYNFSEKMANALTAEMIAQTALQEVRQLVSFTGGAVIFFPESEEEQPQVLASVGKEFFTSRELQAKEGFLRQSLFSGNSGIVNQLNYSVGEGEDNTLRALLHAPLPGKQRLLGVIILASDEEIEYVAADLKLLTTLALQSAAAIESAQLFEKRIQEARDREEAIRRIHEVTTRFVPYEFISALGRERLTELELGDQVERVVTVLFSDIRAYTTLSEEMTPEQNFKFLNSFIGRVSPIITGNEGFIIRFLGDGIMALFLRSPEDGIKACIEIQQKITEYNQQRAKKGRLLIKVGMGLHTGSLIMGIMGNEHRLEANLVSDTVNTASRVEGLTKYYGSNLIITENTLGLLPQKSAFKYRSLGKVQVKGKNQALGIFDVYEADSREVFRKKEKTKAIFEEGMEHYYNRAFEAATASFAQVLAIHPEDKAAQLYLSNAVKYHTSGVREDWAGIEVMEVK